MLQLLKGDCLKRMDEIENGSVDMVLCDLPYGTTMNEWDKQLDLEKLWQQYHRVCKTNAAVVLFAQIPFSVKLGASNLKELRYEWIYEKTNATGFLNAKKMPLKAHENILVFYKKLPTYNPQWSYGKPYVKTRSSSLSSNYRLDLKKTGTVSEDGRRYPRDVIKFSNANNAHKFHPTEKPLALLEYLIKTYTNENEIVLDNCMGAGNTGIAAIKSNRSFIGIELNESYFDIAQERIEQLRLKCD